MPTIIIFVFTLSCGLWGVYRLVEGSDAMRVRRLNGLACLGLLVAGFSGGREIVRTERNSTQRFATLPNATQHDATRRNTTQRIAFDSRWGVAREEEYLDRHAAVTAEIGPPPMPGAVPVMGYTTTSGRTYPSRWRMPPNGSEGDNLK